MEELKYSWTETKSELLEGPYSMWFEPTYRVTLSDKPYSKKIAKVEIKTWPVRGTVEAYIEYSRKEGDSDFEKIGLGEEPETLRRNVEKAIEKHYRKIAKKG